MKRACVGRPLFDIVSIDTPDGQPARERLAFSMPLSSITSELRWRWT